MKPNKKLLRLIKSIEKVCNTEELGELVFINAEDYYKLSIFDKEEEIFDVYFFSHKKYTSKNMKKINNDFYDLIINNLLRLGFYK